MADGWWMGGRYVVDGWQMCVRWVADGWQICGGWVVDGWWIDGGSVVDRWLIVKEKYQALALCFYDYLYFVYDLFLATILSTHSVRLACYSKNPNQIISKNAVSEARTHYLSLRSLTPEPLC